MNVFFVWIMVTHVRHLNVCSCPRVSKLLLSDKGVFSIVSKVSKNSKPITTCKQAMAHFVLARAFLVALTGSLSLLRIVILSLGGTCCSGGGFGRFETVC